MVSYTYGKAMGGNNSRAAQGNVSVPQFSRNLSLETGRTTDDVTQRFVASYNWDLPVVGAGSSAHRCLRFCTLSSETSRSAAL